MKRTTLLLSAYLLASAPVAAQAPTAATSDPLAVLRSTVADIRSVGTAMMHWFTEHAAHSAYRLPASVGEGATKEIDWTACPRASHDDLQSLLVPDYIESVPKVDAWGHEFEFCFERQAVATQPYSFGIRSPGSDGSFAGTTYQRGDFDALDAGQDLVWLDGFFVRWPKSTPQPR